MENIEQNRLPLYNVNGKTYIGEGNIINDSDLIYDPGYVANRMVIATRQESEMAQYPWECPVGKLVGMFTNIRYKYDIPMTKV